MGKDDNTAEDHKGCEGKPALEEQMFRACPIRKERVPPLSPGVLPQQHSPKARISRQNAGFKYGTWTLQVLPPCPLKCNREKPCQNCTARGEESGCRFKGSANGTPLSSRADRNGELMRRRIEHLEDTVKRLIGDSQTVPPRLPPASYHDEHYSGPRGVDGQGPARVGTTVIDGEHSVYEPTNNWHDVLREVNELKKAWGETQAESASHPSSNSVDGTSLLFGHVERVDIPEILSSLPPKHELDNLIQWFFNKKKFPLSVPPIIHEPTFMREYNNHVDNPSRSSVIWIGLLFSILTCTMLAALLSGSQDYHDAEERFDFYRLRTAQCLLIGDIAKCQPYTIETLGLNATAELNRKDDSSRGLWIMTGVIVRAAVNMGYHRDPDHTPSISPMKGEYRRRIWLSVTTMDDMASYLSGFPRMTPAITSDTKEPLNIDDWELSEDITALPLSRPLSEPTSATFMIARGRVSHALGEVIDFMNSCCPDNFTKALEVDRVLEDTWSLLPSHMKVDSNIFDQSPVQSPPNYSYLALECMYHHGICTLHRRFMQSNLEKQSSKISRSRCLASSLALIKFQQLLQPPMYSFSRTRQILAPAAMIILLELEMRRKAPDSASDFVTVTLVEALDKSVVLWKTASGSCDEAATVYKVLNDMIQSIQRGSAKEASQSLVLDSAYYSRIGWNGIGVLNENGIDWAWWDELIESSGLWDGSSMIL
ncbi:fungal specific transcription factor domain-containing protein [Aspergillus mulundensis]|uniref:Putative Zn(II)2Cys6 transcription factor n=1 Tax=Aspergillus mulundensis TaxID=1810919 RepID=A0A3D8R0H8_9EURO|nr:putative Zn(II)2Cys6 transcription factor [Aspergillus mulundensis]RDW67411.1 putative Zn(II)2Cys6 transcription factor [Aspergillus mulundensis]